MLRSLEVAGRRVAFRELGPADGRPVFWCHGGLSCSMDALLLGSAPGAAGARVIAIDRPGIGGSERAPRRSAALWTADLAAVADALEIARFAVAGWSAGSAFALAAAAVLPARVSAAATLGGMIPVTDPSRRAELGLRADRALIPAATRSPRLAGAALGLTRLAPDRMLARQVARAAGTRDGAALDARAFAKTMHAALEPGAAGTVDDYAAFGGDWGFELSAVGARVDVWQGEEDSLVPMAHAGLLAQELPAGHLRPVERAGHFLPALVGEEALSGLLA